METLAPTSALDRLDEHNGQDPVAQSQEAAVTAAKESRMRRMNDWAEKQGALVGAQEVAHKRNGASLLRLAESGRSSPVEVADVAQQYNREVSESKHLTVNPTEDATLTEKFKAGEPYSKAVDGADFGERVKANEDGNLEVEQVAYRLGDDYATEGTVVGQSTLRSPANMEIPQTAPQAQQ